jgi:hypothetical protein
MPFVKRRCVICGHDTTGMIACGMGADKCIGSEERPNLSVKDDIHEHCKEMCWCTMGGCMTEKISLATGEVVP